MRSDELVAAEADLRQAKAFCAQFRADRDELARRLSRHVKALTLATTADGSAAARRQIRNVESELRQIDRMVEGLERRFPGAV